MLVGNTPLAIGKQLDCDQRIERSGLGNIVYGTECCGEVLLLGFLCYEDKCTLKEVEYILLLNRTIYCPVRCCFLRSLLASCVFRLLKGFRTVQQQVCHFKYSNPKRMRTVARLVLYWTASHYSNPKRMRTVVTRFSVDCTASVLIKLQWTGKLWAEIV